MSAPHVSPATIVSRRYIIHTDGACRGNPGPGAWAAIVQLWSGTSLVRQYDLAGTNPSTTNNRMEMMAAIVALTSLVEPVTTSALVVSDGEVLIRGASEWLPGWKVRGWRKANRKPVENRDLWQAIDRLMLRRPTSWQWTRGHAGHALNERCDFLANRALDALSTASL